MDMADVSIAAAAAAVAAAEAIKSDSRSARYTLTAVAVAVVAATSPWCCIKAGRNVEEARPPANNRGLLGEGNVVSKQVNKVLLPLLLLPTRVKGNCAKLHLKGTKRRGERERQRDRDRERKK